MYQISEVKFALCHVNLTSKMSKIVVYLCNSYVIAPRGNHHIPKAIVQRHLQEDNRNSTTRLHFKANYCLKVLNIYLGQFPIVFSVHSF